MVVRNDLDRFHLVMDAAARVPALAGKAATLTRLMQDKRAEHRRYIEEHGEDMPEIRHWEWPYGAGR
jgi:xylulose-5-phosphate/fructose-6-phosphate phosphoketolase